ncbi:hypothetical protein [Micromonospora chokoriensis]|uniref:hypothetical protein n=1 Tax=Micromonospora chokoriensis TaxID=356851 RepID=UPI0004C2EA4F|nr:hypothetical protein [Micromonospora chokoriensis]
MIDLGSISVIVDRPGATPAPRPTPQPKPTADNPLPSRIGPTVTDAAGYTAWLDTLSLDELINECRRGEAEIEWTTGKSIGQVA